MLTALNIAKRAFYIVFAIILLPLSLLTGAVDRTFAGDVYPYESVDRVVGLEALERAQGVTTDGGSWIFSGKKTLVRIAFDNSTILAVNRSAIPEELAAAYGSAHIGGISFYDGKIYAGVEDSGAFEHPLIVVYDAETLAFTGTCKQVDAEYQVRGIPWVACDARRGVIYSARCRNASSLIMHDLETLEFVGTLALSCEIDRIQGAEVYDGCLYAATNDATRAVYRVDLGSGEVSKYFDRIMYQSRLGIANMGGEGEDITVLPMDDGTLFHALDIGALFINANLRHYLPLN